tara:strand:+ start:344 stop:1009 length:666 start_codon:yes stop_codon:yes gene_type:complete
MAVIWQKAKKQSRYDEYVSISSDGRGAFLSSAFIKNNDLLKAERVMIGYDTDDRFTFYFKFVSENNPEAYKLHGKHNNRWINCRSFISENTVLRDIVKMDSKDPMHYEIHKDKFTNTYYFQVIPSFEKTCIPIELPKDINGIYRYKNTDDEIIYIGQGNIKQRYLSPERRDWDILLVEYSQVEDLTKREIYESIYLDKFEKEHGKKPLYNLQAGKKLEAVS